METNMSISFDSLTVDDKRLGRIDAAFEKNQFWQNSLQCEGLEGPSIYDTFSFYAILASLEMSDLYPDSKRNLSGQ